MPVGTYASYFTALNKQLASPLVVKTNLSLDVWLAAAILAPVASSLEPAEGSSMERTSRAEPVRPNYEAAFQVLARSLADSAMRLLQVQEGRNGGTGLYNAFQRMTLRVVKQLKSVDPSLKAVKELILPLRGLFLKPK